MNSEYFHVLTGVRQGGVLSPYLFRFYVHDIIQFTRMNVGCSVGRSMINLLCFADAYMVLIAPSWNGLQLLIDTLYILADEINMSFNTSKTVCRLWCLIHQFLERL